MVEPRKKALSTMCLLMLFLSLIIKKPEVDKPTLPMNGVKIFLLHTSYFAKKISFLGKTENHQDKYNPVAYAFCQDRYKHFAKPAALVLQPYPLHSLHIVLMPSAFPGDV